MRKDILIKNVDIHLLRKQRDELDVIDTEDIPMNCRRAELVDGLLNMLDDMIDIAEGIKHGK